jgi:phosphoribosylanthranilate isomerase
MPAAAAAPRTRIKICGVRRPEDAAHAAAVGADAIGLICHEPAGRYVPPDVARRIVAALPPFVTPVALFVDADPAKVAAVCDALGVRHVQLHGHETPADVRALAPRPVLKAVRVDRSTFERELDAWRTAVERDGLDNLAGFVLETAGPGVGGTGQTNDWAFVADVAARGGFAGLPPVVAAGGLTPDTVAAVVAAIRPWAVDVSSGVERVRGEKDPALVGWFVAAVREADDGVRMKAEG